MCGSILKYNTLITLMNWAEKRVNHLQDCE